MTSLTDQPRKPEPQLARLDWKSPFAIPPYAKGRREERERQEAETEE